MTLGKKIKLARVAKDLTQRQVADMLGVSQPSYLEWEHGDSVPNWARMKALAKILEISLDELAKEDT